MIKLAITGNAGSGKSTITGILSELGAAVISADKINFSLLKHSKFLTEWLEAALNCNLCDDNSALDKQLLRDAVFKDPVRKNITVKLLHPIIKNNIDLHLSISRNKRYCIVEIPLLFETGMHNLYDRIILIQSYNELLVERISKRPGISKTIALNILDTQAHMDIKLEHSDDIIANNSSIDDINSSAKHIHKSILKQSERPS